MKDEQTKKYIKLVTYALVCYFLLMNFGNVLRILGVVIATLNPFFLGFIVAFILNKPFMFFRDKVYVKLEEKLGWKDNKPLRATLSVVTVYALMYLIIGLLMAFVVPQLIDSVSVLINSIPRYTRELTAWGNSVIDMFVKNKDMLSQVQKYSDTIISTLSSFLSKSIPQVMVSLSGFASNLFDLMMSMMISIYLLTKKDTLIYRFRMILKAYLPSKRTNKIFEIIDLSADTFGNYIIGQMTDACILGILCFIGMTILGLPYALLISVICGVTNLIPVFGPYIGAVPSAFILLMVEPIYAVYFTAMIIIAQQIDGNFIYPKVVGDKVGISGLFVLFAIVVGGKLMGIVGMVLGVPTFAVIYTVFKNHTKKKLAEKNIPIKQVEG